MMSGTDTAQSGAQVDPSYRRKPPTALLDQIERLQRDGLLLLDHLTKRPGRRFAQSDNIDPTANPENDGAGQPPAPGSPEAAPSPAAPQAAPAVALPEAAPTRKAATRKAEIDDLLLDPLTRTPKEVAEGKHGLRDLVLLVDTLARMADPVTPTTIHNSRDKFRYWADLVLLLVLGFCFFLSIAMLWRAEEARSLVTQVRQTQEAAHAVFGKLRLLNAADHFAVECGGATRSCVTPPQNQPLSRAIQNRPNNDISPGQANNGALLTQNDVATAHLKYLPFCLPGMDKAGRDREVPFLAPRSRDAEGLCSELAQHQVREGILFGRLHAWNCTLSQDSPQGIVLGLLIRPISDGPKFDFAGCQPSRTTVSETAPAASCGHTAQTTAAATCATTDTSGNTPTSNERRDLVDDWRRSEFRTVAILTLLANYLLPSLLAFLGACIYLLRLRFRQRAQSALEAMGMAAPARLIMPAVFGGLLSIAWSGGDAVNPTTIKISEISLSLTLMAFLLGYAFDPALEWLEGKIRETFLKLNGETKEVKVH